MKNLIITFSLLLSLSVFSIEHSLGHFIFNDISTITSLKTRTTYLDSSDSPWQVMSNVGVAASFPKLKQYLEVSPHIEFEYVSNHINNSDTMTRLVESYVDVYFDQGTVSVGNKRLHFQEGQFISDSKFSLIKRSFSQVSYRNSNETIKVYSILNVANSNSVDTVSFEKPSMFFSWKKLLSFHSLTVDSYAFFIENHSDTYFISPKYKLSRNESIVSNIGVQLTPSITSDPTSSKKASYYDFTYVNKDVNASLLLGTRYFSGGPSSYDQFNAPYSSGHSWDGYLNVFQTNIKTGFSTNFQSLYGKLNIMLADHKKVSLHGYLFRTGDFATNLGAEVDLSISDHIFSDNITWTYKLSQYISGQDNSTPSDFGMWLDFGVQMDDT